MVRLSKKLTGSGPSEWVEKIEESSEELEEGSQGRKGVGRERNPSTRITEWN